MNTPRFFCPCKLTAGLIDLPEGVARHIARALRMRVGDTLTLFDGQGGEYAARILTIEKNRVSVDVLDWLDLERESPLKLTLIQALQSGDKMDMTIQKAVELGTSKIIPVLSTRSVLRLSGERAQKRLEHWQGVIVAACEQCGRNRLPEIMPILPLDRQLGNSAGAALRLVLDPVAEKSLAHLPRPPLDGSVEILIGAEGGLSPEEIALAKLAGFVGVRMGPRVLRTETAALTALCVVQHLWGDLACGGGHHV